MSQIVVINALNSQFPRSSLSGSELLSSPSLFSSLPHFTLSTPPSPSPSPSPSSPTSLSPTFPSLSPSPSSSFSSLSINEAGGREGGNEEKKLKCDSESEKEVEIKREGGEGGEGRREGEEEILKVEGEGNEGGIEEQGRVKETKDESVCTVLCIWMHACSVNAVFLSVCMFV